MAPVPVLANGSSPAFAPPTTNKIGAMGAIVPAYFSMTRIQVRAESEQVDK